MTDTNNELLGLSVLKAASEELDKSHKVAAVFMSGSRLNNLDSIYSDFDVYVLVQSSKTDILSNQIFSKKAELRAGAVYDKINNEVLSDIPVDATIWDQRQLFKLINKSNPNVLEILSSKPIYLSSKYGNLYKTLTNPANQHYLREANPKALFAAVGGMLNNERNQLLREAPRSLKDVSLMAKYIYYLRQVINDQNVNVDMQAIDDERPRELRKRVEDDFLSYSEALRIMVKFEIEFHQLKKQLAEKDQGKIAEKQKEAKRFFEKCFWNSLLID